MSAMEIMVQSLIRASGFDPAKIKGEVEAYIQSFQASADLLNKQMHLISLRLENIEKALHIDKPNNPDTDNAPRELN